MNKPKYNIGDLIRFRFFPPMLGVIIKVTKGPFVWKYRIKWATPDDFDSHGVRLGWKHDGWFSEYSIESAREKNDD